MSWPWPLTYFKVNFVAERGTTILWICLLILLGQCIRSILFWHLLWNASHRLMSPIVILQHSDPYIDQYRLDIGVEDIHFDLQDVDASFPYLVQSKEGISGFLQPGFDVIARRLLHPLLLPTQKRLENGGERKEWDGWQATVERSVTRLMFHEEQRDNGTSSWSFPSIFKSLSTLMLILMDLGFPLLIFKPGFLSHSLTAVVLYCWSLNLLDSRLMSSTKSRSSRSYVTHLHLRPVFAPSAMFLITLSSTRNRRPDMLPAWFTPL